MERSGEFHFLYLNSVYKSQIHDGKVKCGASIGLYGSAAANSRVVYRMSWSSVLTGIDYQSYDRSDRSTMTMVESQASQEPEWI